MSEKARIDYRGLGDLCTPWCLRLAVTLRLADHIEAGATGLDELAAAAGADRDALDRVMRHLVGRGVFAQPAPGRFALAPASRALSGGTPGLDLDRIGGRMALAWTGLLEAVRTGEPAYPKLFGRTFWEDLAANPDLGASYDAMMGQPGAAPDPEVLLDGDWDGVRHVVDVGGGTGSLLAEILRAHPGVRGTLVDLPRTVALSGDVLGAAELRDRVAVAGQSFFEPLPAGADVYVLQRVLGNWADPEAVTILGRCAGAAPPAGRVVVAGDVPPDDADVSAGDLVMMLLFGGRTRTLAEFGRLAAQAGLRVRATGRQPSGQFLVECVPA